MRRTVIGLFTAIVLVIVFLVLCTFVRKPYEYVLLDRFGHIIEQDQQTRIMYNWYFKLPTDSVIRVDTRLHMDTTPLQEVVTSGGDSISVRAYSAWRIVDPVKFYRTTTGSDTRAKQIMEQKIGGLIQAKLASHKLEEIFNVDDSKIHTDEIEKEVADEASNGSPDASAPGRRTPGVKDQGLEIVQIGFSRMAFPPANANAVYARMSAERYKQAAAYKSQGDSDAKAIVAAGENDAIKIRSEAQKKAGEIRGEGDRKALEILAGVQESPAARDFYEYWKSMEFVKTSLAKNTYLVLPTDADWLKSLFTAPTNTATQQGAAAPASPSQPISIAK
ncbi:MAG TPA: protease modulator HflC [Phycisphaerae bacterium]|nr:protease modulator HflC [Phycisphaerae bacterium]